MAKLRARKDREEEAESGTPSSVDGGSNQKMKTPTKKTQNLLVNRPPVTKRYATRQSKAVLQSPSQVAVTPAASSRSASISGRSWTARRGTLMECCNNSESAAEEEWSFPTPEDITKFTSAILREDSPDEVPAPVLPEPVADTNNLPPDENAHEGSNVIGTKREVNNCRESQPKSINITEMAAMLNGSLSDPDEVDSSLNPSLVTVHGYRVKKEIASLLRDIIAKYGDVAEKCTFQGRNSRSTILEMMCGIIQRLERPRFEEIVSTELQSILVEISDLTSIGLNVGWLKDRVEMVSKALMLFKGAPDLKVAKSKKKEDMELKEKAVELLEQKLCSEKEELAAIKADLEKTEEMVVETKSTVKCFLGRSVVEGLF